MSVVRAALARCDGGAGGSLLVAGEPGIGKTRMLEEAVALARARGALVLWGRCYDGADAPAFWPWRQAIRAYLDGRDPAAVRTVTVGHDPPRCSRWTPVEQRLGGPISLSGAGRPLRDGATVLGAIGDTQTTTG